MTSQSTCLYNPPVTTFPFTPKARIWLSVQSLVHLKLTENMNELGAVQAWQRRLSPGHWLMCVQRSEQIERLARLVADVRLFPWMHSLLVCRKPGWLSECLATVRWSESLDSSMIGYMCYTSMSLPYNWRQYRQAGDDSGSWGSEVRCFMTASAG